MGVGGVGSGNQTGGAGGEDTPSTGTGTEGAPGTGGAGGTGGTGGTEGSTGEGGLDFGGDFGFTSPDPTNTDETSSSDTDMASRNLCNTIALRVTEDSAARSQIIGSHDDVNRANEGDRADSRLQADSDTYRSDSRTETRTGNLGEAFRSGDRRVIDNVFKNLMGGGRENPNPTRTANPSTSGTPLPNQPTGTPTGTRAEGNPNPTGTHPPPDSHPPLLPGATGRAATLTQPRMDQLGSRIASMPNGEQKTEAQQLETRLRAAIASGNTEEASQIMDQLAAMGIEVGGEEDTDEVGTEGEIGEGEGAEGEGEGAVGRRGGDGERPTPRTAKTHLSSDTLNAGVMVFHSGGEGGGERYDVMTRSRIGIETLCSGRGTEAATRLSTDAAVRGVLDDNPGSDDSAGGGGRRSSDTGPEITGSDGTRRLAVVDAPGPLGNFAVRDERTGRIYGMYDARLGGDVMPGVRDYARVRTRIGAEAISGASAASTGELWAGMRC